MDRLLYRQENGIGYLTLNRPDNYNAIDQPMVLALEAFFRDRMYDDDTRVIILDGGNAKGFCAGLDMKSFGQDVSTSSGHAENPPACYILCPRSCCWPWFFTDHGF